LYLQISAQKYTGNNTFAQLPPYEDELSYYKMDIMEESKKA